MMINESRRSRAHFDLPLVLLVFGLAAFGVLAVSVATFSTSSAEEDTLLNYIVASYYGLRQSIFFLISPVIIGVITYFPYEFIRRRSSLFYFVASGLLLITLVSNQAQGVKAWTDLIWGYTIQPSEFVKLACIIVVAKYLENNTDPMGDLKGTLETLVKGLYGPDAVMRLRPHHFPFTEPSCEVDLQCFKCHGTGETDGQVCSTCHGEGWIELLGAGMVHPKVLEGCGIDSKKYSGFAFGIGLERMAMGRLRFNDLRLIFDNDIRFLSQF